MREPVVSKVLKYTLYVVFVAGAAGTATLPWMLDTYMRVLYDAYALQPGYRLFLLVFLIAVAVPGLWIIAEMILMLRTIPQGPFVMKNVRGLRRCGVVLAVLAAIFFLKCAYYVTFLTMAGGFLFLLCALFAFTLSSLFRQAVAFKEENDLTI